VGVRGTTWYQVFRGLLGYDQCCIETTVHGDLDGYVFKQESGNSFNGSDVLAVYATPFFYFDSTERRKVFHKLSIYTRPEGTSEFNLAVYL
jgi:hypothetical protein